MNDIVESLKSKSHTESDDTHFFYFNVKQIIATECGVY